MAMNVSMIRGVLGSLSERTKLVAVAVAALLFGMWLGGGSKVSTNGRFVPFPGETGAVLDTSTGQMWVADPSDPHRYRKGANLPSWF